MKSERPVAVGATPGPARTRTATDGALVLPGPDALIDLYLAERRAWWEGQRPQARGLERGWRASQLGTCLRAQMLEAAGVPKTRVLDARTLRTFAWGDMVEDWLKLIYDRLGLLVASQVPLEDDELRLSGHVDLLLRWPPRDVGDEPAARLEAWSDEWREWLRHLRGRIAETWSGPPTTMLLEVKSTHSRSLPYLVREGKPRKTHAVQVGAYRLLAERHPEQLPEAVGARIDRWAVAYVGKDTAGVVTLGVPASWRDVAEERVRRLNAYLHKKVAPQDVPCECEDWEVEYCAYGVRLDDGANGPRFACCLGAGRYERRWKAGEKE